MSVKASNDFRPSEIQERLEYLLRMRAALPEHKKNAVSYEISFQEETQFYYKESGSNTIVFRYSFKKG